MLGIRFAVEASKGAMRLTPLLLAATLVVSAAPAAAGPISALYVFGDSLSDNGNLSLIGATLGISVPNAPYAPGRATNGLTAAEVLAAQLGLPLTPALTPGVGGNNYAVIGAATGAVPRSFDPAVPDGPDNIVSSYGITLPVATGMFNAQLPLFLSTLTGPIDPDALFFIWGGANDLFMAPSTDTADDAAENIQDMVSALYAAGARRFLVPSLPDLSLVPGGDPALGPLTSYFNALLIDKLSGPGMLPGMELLTFDTAEYFNKVVADPSNYGFTNVDDECYQGFPLAVAGPTFQCATPASYLFWDQVHPTASAHALLGENFYEVVAPLNAVPEPMTLTLAGLGVAAVVARRRRVA